MPLGKKLTIAVDIDGTVADCSAVDFGRVSEDSCELMKARPIKGAMNAVKELYDGGHTIVFCSSRDHGSKAITKK